MTIAALVAEAEKSSTDNGEEPMARVAFLLFAASLRVAEETRGKKPCSMTPAEDAYDAARAKWLEQQVVHPGKLYTEVVP